MQQANEVNIINAARELIYQDGYSTVTMSKIRQRADVDKKELENYFDSKKEVALAVISQITNYWDQELNQNILAKKTGEQAISAMFDWIIDLHQQKGAKFSYSISNILYELYNVNHDFAVQIDKFTSTWVLLLSTKISELHTGIGKDNSNSQANNAVKLLESTMIMTKMTGRIEPIKAAIQEIKIKLNL
ncbi:TetR/AcrR family transcriptional regulator [Paucilactobacillus kaifaensis]|uniref:TetR/AcrR family transcriptional regulator n=1 Tax=Paucilactobacillus kaifaensis TaxID=2559921 RepID=UPI0010F97C89|nr:TetR/AcrR family transcriptional regulator [Paucilactobacillus kaifaensis]